MENNNNFVKFDISGLKIGDDVSIETGNISVSYDTEVLTSSMKMLTDLLGAGVVGKFLFEVISLKKEEQKIRKDEQNLREKESDLKRKELEIRKKEIEMGFKK